MTATIVPTGTTSPTAARISASTPVEVAGTSMEVLSVSISNRASPGRTASPGALYHCVILPSATVSPSCGIRTSIGPLASALLPADCIAFPEEAAPRGSFEWNADRWRGLCEAAGAIAGRPRPPQAAPHRTHPVASALRVSTSLAVSSAPRRTLAADWRAQGLGLRQFPRAVGRSPDLLLEEADRTMILSNRIMRRRWGPSGLRLGSLRRCRPAECRKGEQRHGQY